MNIHVPQSYRTTIELEELAIVEKQMISPTTSKPIFGMKMDACVGSWLLTQPTTKLKWNDVMDIISLETMDKLDKKIKYNIEKGKEYTGLELLSMIIPDKVNMTQKDVVIKNGIIEKGIITGDLLKEKKNNLFQYVYDEYGSDQTRILMNNVQRMMNEFLIRNGFTVGIKDIYLGKDTEEKIHNLIKSKKIEINCKITDHENNPTMVNNELYEAELAAEAAAFSSKTSKSVEDQLKNLMKFNNDMNNFIALITSGSKGKITNIDQMCGAVGQQAMDMKRMPLKMRNRALPFFHQFDNSLSARGYVEHSLITGLNFFEMVFHNITSRNGMVDTALKTAESGYIQRKIVKALEDIWITYDNMVRRANGKVIQYYYGNAGIDTTRQYTNFIVFVDMSNKDIINNCSLSEEQLNELNISNKENENIINTIISSRDIIRKCKVKSYFEYVTNEVTVFLPFNLERIISNNKAIKIEGDKLSGEYIINKINELLEPKNTRLLGMTEEQINDILSFKYKDHFVTKEVLKGILYFYLSPKKCLENNINQKQFDNMIKDFNKAINKGYVEPGEMVGTIAAQSIGEPTTQFTLNSIDYKEKLLIFQNNNTKVIEIGKFIDDLLVKGNITKPNEGDNLPDGKRNVFYLDIEKQGYKIHSVTENGKVKILPIKAITKHFPVNKDGSNILLKVTTETGKSVVATKAKSFLTRKNNKLVAINGDELKVGMTLPVMKNSNTHIKLQYLDLTQYFPKNEYIYGIKDDVFVENIRGIENGNYNRAKLIEKLKEINTTETNELLNDIENSDVYDDKIKSIEEVKPTNEYVYDLTVEETKTFCLANALFLFDTFHSSGIASRSLATAGVPRVKELLSCSSKMKTQKMLLYLKDEYKGSEKMANAVAYQMKLTKFEDIIKKVDVIYDRQPYEKNSIMMKDNIISLFSLKKTKSMGCRNNIIGLPLVARIELDKDKLLETNITLMDIKSKFCDLWEHRYDNLKSKENRNQIINLINNITGCAILSNTDYDDQPIVHIRLNMKVMSITMITQFIEQVLLNYNLKGYQGIKEISSIRKTEQVVFNSDGKKEMKDEWMIEVDGLNLVDVKYMKCLDFSRFMCNDVMAMTNMFGIDIGRNILLNQLRITYADAGNAVGQSHLELLVDLMTSSGKMTSIDRHGMDRRQNEPLGSASFEKPVDNLLNASIYGDTDHLKGVSARLMTGQLIRGGTGICDIMLDMNMIRNSEYVEKKKEIKKIEESELINEVKNKVEKKKEDEVEKKKEDELGFFLPTF